MNLFKDRAFRRKWIIAFCGCLVAILIESVIFHEISGSVIILLLSILYGICDYIYQRERYTRIERVCDDVDRLLLHMDQDMFSIEEYEEGELGILSAQIHKMTIKLREQNDTLSKNHTYLKEATEDLSHQLRTPLSSIMILMDLMRKPESSRRERMEYSAEIIKLLEKMSWQIETLLSIARMDAGEIRFRKDQIDCTDLIKQTLEPFYIPMELKGIRLEWTQPKQPITIEGDLEFCREAISNIIKNCIDHANETQGLVGILCTQNELYTQICVYDNGAGISLEDRAHLFDRFYRGDSYGKNGYGIGLAFAKKIMEAQNGSIAVEEHQPTGARFILRWNRT